ncbi:MAG TPA: F0F1 ATP synthase subunit epsilon [Bacteroidaceae bacterium]|nr:F0F1 ATP synthase subunit epsilon [Bacteroidaceae bacterium]
MLELKIMSPDKTLFEGLVSSVKFPGALGSFMVLKRHAPIISSLVKGEIVCEGENGRSVFLINGGFVKVIDNVISVCVEI